MNMKKYWNIDEFRWAEREEYYPCKFDVLTYTLLVLLKTCISFIGYIKLNAHDPNKYNRQNIGTYDSGGKQKKSSIPPKCFAMVALNCAGRVMISHKRIPVWKAITSKHIHI